MNMIFGHVTAVHAVAVLAAEDLKVEALTVHLQALRFAAVAADFLHFLDFVETLPLLRTATHLPPLLAQQLPPRFGRLLYRVFFHF
jgi:hypothetical protein